jgi:hypothetical protein
MNIGRKTLQKQLDSRKSARNSLLEKITNVLQSDNRFVAAWLTGSLGRHGGDALSDIDLTVVVDSQRMVNLCNRPWMIAGRTTEQRLELFSQFGEPVIIHENHHNAPENGTFTCVIYGEDALAVDWTLIPLESATLPPFHLMLFKKIDIPHRKQDSAESREERALAASEKVAFFWMMMTVTIKYMLRRDVVYFHILLDGLHRILNEVARLVEERPYAYHSGSLVTLAVTYSEQVAALREIEAQIPNLMSRVAELGGYVPDQPMRLIEHLLAFGLIER